MEKRVVVFLVLSLAIIFGYEYVLKGLGLAPEQTVSQPKEPSSQESPVLAEAGKSADSVVSPSAPKTPSNTQPASPSVQPQEPQNQPTAEIIVVEAPFYQAKFTGRGAGLTSWELTKYRSSGDGKSPVQLVRQGGKFLDPLTVTTDDAALTKEFTEGTYRVERDFTILDQAHPVGHLTFRYENGATGVKLEKQLTFHADSYVVDVTLKHTGLTGSVKVELGTNFGVVEWGEGFIGSVGTVSLVDDKIDTDVPDKEVEPKGTLKWTALQDKYFIAAFLPAGPASPLPKKQGDRLMSSAMRMNVDTSGTPLSLRLFAGPKEYDTLLQMGNRLEDTIDFGWFLFGSWDMVRAVAKPIFSVLRSINEYTHNYGVTIILLTVAIKILFVPLQYKSYKSMKQMQGIQPKVAALQEKLKDDRERLNRELIKLYRDHKVNPVGGCLPMVLQMPVFVALFNILYMSIDLRQAPLGMWISDLSVQDPYYILPIIMGISMVIMQKIQPTTMDPAQAKMMLMLPAVMTFLFINFPAGLVLYWLTNNVLSIIQQFVTDRFIFKKGMLTAPVVAEGGKE